MSIDQREAQLGCWSRGPFLGASPKQAITTTITVTITSTITIITISNTIVTIVNTMHPGSLDCSRRTPVGGSSSQFGWGLRNSRSPDSD